MRLQARAESLVPGVTPQASYSGWRERVPERDERHALVSSINACSRGTRAADCLAVEGSVLLRRGEHTSD